MEYFVCVYGHLHGSCWLARLSSDDDDDNDDVNNKDIDGDDEAGRSTKRIIQSTDFI
jgi:hypothetical protein